VGAVPEHFLRDVPGNPHDRLVTRFGLGQFRDGLVACVMEPKPFEGTLEVTGIGAALGTRFSRILERAAP